MKLGLIAPLLFCVAAAISDVVGAKVSCSASEVHRIVVSASEAYFGAAVRCDVARVCKLDPAPFTASFDARMKSFGWNGFHLDGTTITGTQTSRVCSSYGSASAAAD